jgi:hypothetical protein
LVSTILDLLRKKENILCNLILPEMKGSLSAMPFAVDHDLPWTDLVPEQEFQSRNTHVSKIDFLKELLPSLRKHGESRLRELYRKFWLPISLQLVCCKSLLLKIDVNAS